MPDVLRDQSRFIAPPSSHLGLLGLMLLAGCAPAMLDRAPAAADRPWRPATTASGEIIPGAAELPDDGGPGQGFILPPNPAAAVLAPGPIIDPERSYGLADLIDLAEDNDQTTRIAWRQARNAALTAGVARSAFLPSLTVSAVGGVQTSQGEASALGLGAGSDVTTTGGVISALLNWLLFDFGEREAVVAVADQATIIANIHFTAAHQQLIHGVALAYYAWSAAQARVATAAQSLVDAREIQAAAEARYAQGVGTVIEVAHARHGTAQAVLAEVQAQGAERDAYAALMVATGLSPLTAIKLAPLPTRSLSPATLQPIDQMVTQALARRPDVLAAYAAEKAAVARVEAANAGLWPKIFVSGNAAYNTGDLAVSALPAVGDQAPTLNVSNAGSGGSILGGISLPLLDGGRGRAGLEQARNDAEAARLTLDRVKAEAVRQLVTAQNGLRTNLEAFAAAESLLNAAQTTYDAALDAYRQDVVSITEVLLAERQLLEARNAVTAAQSASLASAATLALAAGVLGASPDT